MEQTTKDKISAKNKDWWATHPEYKRPKASEETKEKMRLAKLGKPRNPFTQEHKDNIKKALLNNDNAKKDKTV